MSGARASTRRTPPAGPRPCQTWRLWCAVLVFVGLLPAVSAGGAEPEVQPIRAFCIDFNWGPGGPNGFAPPGLWADASPEEHVAWYGGLGANVIQTFAVSCNGYAWYKGGVVPEQPGLRHDFLTEVVRLGHERGMKVMGYFCVGANTLWANEHPDLSYGAPSAPHIPFTAEYLDYLCASITDGLQLTGMDGFMIDWVWNASGKWLDCEKGMYEELMDEPFPGPGGVDDGKLLEFSRRAVDRCWGRIREAAKGANPDCVIWLSCNNVTNPSVVDSRMFREVDWLMNEATDPAALRGVERMKGEQTRLVQCVVGWGDSHDARAIVSGADAGGMGIYGFSAPRATSLPLPIAEYRNRPIIGFQGNDRNIAVLARYYRGELIDVTAPQGPGGEIVLAPESANARGTSPFLTEGQIGNWANPSDCVTWLVNVEKPGTFEVEMEYACAPGCGGSTLDVVVGKESLRLVSEETGGWRDYRQTRLGRVRVAEAGQCCVTVRPCTETPWKAVSLKGLTFRPVP